MKSVKKISYVKSSMRAAYRRTQRTVVVRYVELRGESYVNDDDPR